MSEGIFRMPFPPSSGTTGVTHEPSSCMPDSTNACIPARLINALERRERAAHRGDSDIISSYLFGIDRPCLFFVTYIVVFPLTERDGEGDPPS
jgi:hypothetical protein